jgi:hypothetical protein
MFILGRTHSYELVAQPILDLRHVQDRDPKKNKLNKMGPKKKCECMNEWKRKKIMNKWDVKWKNCRHCATSRCNCKQQRFRREEQATKMKKWNNRGKNEQKQVALQNLTLEKIEVKIIIILAKLTWKDCSSMRLVVASHATMAK